MRVVGVYVVPCDSKKKSLVRFLPVQPLVWSSPNNYGRGEAAVVRHVELGSSAWRPCASREGLGGCGDSLLSLLLALSLLIGLQLGRSLGVSSLGSARVLNVVSYCRDDFGCARGCGHALPQHRQRVPLHETTRARLRSGNCCCCDVLRDCHGSRVAYAPHEAGVGVPQSTVGTYLPLFVAAATSAI